MFQGNSNRNPEPPVMTPRGRILGVFAKFLNWKTRRMIFLSSIYGLIMDITKPDASNAEKLSKVLNIGRTGKGIEFPIAIKSVIWYRCLDSSLEVQGRTLHLRDLANPSLSEEDGSLMVETIINIMPSWLRYAKRSQMVYDLQRLVKHLQSGNKVAT